MKSHVCQVETPGDGEAIYSTTGPKGGAENEGNDEERRNSERSKIFQAANLLSEHVDNSNESL